MNVIFCSQGIDDFAAKYLVNKNAIGFRRITKRDLKLIATLTGATIIKSLADEDENETYTDDMSGHADKVYETKMGDDD